MVPGTFSRSATAVGVGSFLSSITRPAATLGITNNQISKMKSISGPKRPNLKFKTIKQP